jgi:hypothetical protein
MSTPSVAPSAVSETTSPLIISDRVARRSAIPSWPWRRGAMLLAGAAQLIAISRLVSADPLAATWAAVLLASAPVVLAAATAFLPARIGRLTAVAGIVVMVIGIIGAINHTGLFFVPALGVLVVATITLWREPT